MAKSPALERTFSIIKPDATRRNLTGAINAKIEAAGLRIVGQKRVKWKLADAKKFYAVHAKRPFFKDLVKFMASGPIVVQVLEGKNAVVKYRDIMGATNPKDAAKGTRKLQRLAEIALKHALWLMIAWWTGGAWVLYFNDAPTLVKQLVTFQAPMLAYIWIGILTATTYVLAGFMREQVCVYMCPWPRIQAALTDEWALNVTYKYDRGETRTSLKKANELRALGEPVGDCVDCYQCVAVCPTGIDIRDGSQLDCIQCGLCIDACDTVMKKIGRETRLIGYDNDINIQRRQAGKPPIYRIIRPRTAVYSVMIAAVGAIMLYALLTRSLLDINVLHDRNPVAVKLSDGSIRNAYTVRLLNKRGFDRVIAIDIDGPVNAVVHIVGADSVTPDRPMIVLGRDQTTELRLLVTAPSESNPQKSIPVRFRVTDIGLGEAASATDHFVAP